MDLVIMDIVMHPSSLFILFAMLLWIVPERLLSISKLVAALVVLVVVYNLPMDTKLNIPFINQMELQLLAVNFLRWTFAITVLAMFSIVQLYGWQVRKRGEIVASFLYGAGALGCIFAGDWLSLLFFWELMAISSTFLVWFGQSKNATKAGIRYLIYHFFGGNLLLFGVLLKVYQGDSSIAILTGDFDLAFWFIFLGFAVNAAVPPLHTWLTDAYPETSVSGIVFMNIFTTKIAVLLILQVFPGETFLIWLGIGMALYGVLYAILENNIRRLLSYHIVSQVGLMIAAIGIGTEMAINGAFALAIGNILFKSLLFMSCGVVIQTMGRWKLTDLGGLYKHMPVNTGLFMLGALAIAGFPFLNGYVSKALITAAATEYHPFLVIAIYVASVGTVLSIPLKLGYFGFIFHTNQGKQSGQAKRSSQQKVAIHSEKTHMKDITSMYSAMLMVAIACIGLGIFPQWLYQQLPFEVAYRPYSLSKVVQEVLFMAGITAVFVALSPRLTAKRTITLDIDWFLRRLLVRGVQKLADRLNILGNGMKDRYQRARIILVARVATYEPDRNRLLLEWIIVPSLLVFVISMMLIIAVKP